MPEILGFIRIVDRDSNVVYIRSSSIVKIEECCNERRYACTIVHAASPFAVLCKQTVSEVFALMSAIK
jgi:hypothetical protein